MIPVFKERLQQIDSEFSSFDTLQTLQLNLGNLCNLSCTHCHINASPRGERMMGQKVMKKFVSFLHAQQNISLDITGGCPEMNPSFRYLIESTDGLVQRRMVRSNLAICLEPGMEWLPEFYQQHGIVLIASLPCYLEEHVDNQRGKGVYDKSI